MTLFAAGPQEYVQQLASNLGELDNQNPSTQPAALENIKRLTHELVRTGPGSTLCWERYCLVTNQITDCVLPDFHDDRDEKVVVLLVTRQSGGKRLTSCQWHNDIYPFHSIFLEGKQQSTAQSTGGILDPQCAT